METRWDAKGVRLCLGETFGRKMENYRGKIVFRGYISLEDLILQGLDCAHQRNLIGRLDTTRVRCFSG